eukprot:scaffold14413_cov60-Phaeocystis_antarctica.AAC.5
MLSRGVFGGPSPELALPPAWHSRPRPLHPPSGNPPLIYRRPRHKRSACCGVGRNACRTRVATCGAVGA